VLGGPDRLLDLEAGHLGVEQGSMRPEQKPIVARLSDQPLEAGLKVPHPVSCEFSLSVKNRAVCDLIRRVPVGPNSSTLKVWVKPCGQRFPVMVGDRRIKVMFEVIEMIEGDQMNEPPTKETRLGQRFMSTCVVGNVDCNQRK
jgi:hypothetical protein